MTRRTERGGTRSGPPEMMGDVVTATDVGTTTTREDATATPAAPRRRIGSRLSTGHVVMIVAGLLAALANVALIRGASDTVVALVAREDLPLGTAVTSSMLRPVDVQLDGATLGTLLRPDDLAAYEGQVTSVAIPAGAPVRLGDLRPAATSEPGLRRISVPIPRNQAVGGDLSVDDRVDVIQVVDGTARFIVADARVLDVATSDGGSLGATGSFFVTIGVDAETALCLASAIDAGGISMVLSTGQEPVATSPCVQPGDAADGSTGNGATAPPPATTGDPNAPAEQQPATAGEPAQAGR